MFYFFSFVAWILHRSSQQRVQAKSMLFEITNEIPSVDVVTMKQQSTLNARKHPTRTLKSENIKQLLKRSEMESDQDKDQSPKKFKNKKSLPPTRTRKLSFAPEKIIDYKPKFHQI